MKVALIYSDGLSKYDFGSGHPFRGDRFLNFIRLFRELKLHENPIFRVVKPKPANESDLLLVHDADYVAMIKRLSERGGVMLTPDTPILPGLYEAAKLVAGSSIMAADLAQKGDYKIAIAVGGGLHHAGSSSGGGFCLFNDVAISAAHLLKRHGLKRVLVLDTDAHAGNGTSEIFYNDPRVLFVSIHQDPLTLYPGVGFSDEIGAGDGEGYNVNIPLPPLASDRSYVHVFDEIIDPLVSEFKPEIIIRNGGSDPHFADELTRLGLTLEGFKMIGKRVSALADRLCGGKMVDCIGSGYNREVLPYAWMALILGVVKLDVKLKEPISPPKWLGNADVFKRTEEVVRKVKRVLHPYWDAFK